MTVKIKTRPEATLPTANDVSIMAGDTDLAGVVTGVTVRMEPGEAVIAELELMPQCLEVDAVERWVMMCPKTGEWRQIKRVEFVDGETWEP